MARYCASDNCSRGVRLPARSRVKHGGRNVASSQRATTRYDNFRFVSGEAISNIGLWPSRFDFIVKVGSPVSCWNSWNSGNEGVYAIECNCVALRKTVDTRLLPFYGIRVDDSIDSIRFDPIRFYTDRSSF